MKKNLILLFLLAVSLIQTLSYAQAPNGINYQAVIRNSTGTLMANTPTAIRVSIRQTTATGTIVYSERQNVTTDQFGLVNFVIGSGTLLSGNFTNIPWANGPFFLDLGVAFSGLPNPAIYMPYGTQQMMSVPYALYAKSSGNLVNQWKYGAGVPASNLGLVGDYYLDTATGNVYTKTNSTTWVLISNIMGPQGPIGLTGATGATGPQGPIGLTGPQGLAGAAGAQGPAGPTGATGATGATGLTGAAGVAGPAGTNGTNGTAVLNGINNPAAGTGVNGDFYINTATNTLFGPKANGAWPAGVSLVGPQGIQGIQGVAGPTGATGLAGAAGPQGPTGATGATGATGLTGAAGVAGPAGTNGTNGTNGVNGTAVLNGITNPVAGTGVNGDFYINTATNTLFGPKANGAWPAGVSLVGPTGATGLTGAAGATGPQGPIGLTGPTGATGLTGAAGPQGLQGIQGVAGPAGTNGTNGTNGVNGTAVLNGITNPVAGTGVNGDFYINTATNTLFGPKANGAWPAGVSLVGPTGATGLTGAAGPQGPQGIQGLTGPAGAQGIQGLPGTNGAAGATGPAGPQGATGQTGLTGPAGPQGIQGVAGPAGTGGLLPSGSAAGNTPYWDGSQWVVNGTNLYNNGTNIGVGTVSPDASSISDLTSTTQGFLMPRMTTIQRNAIANPANGLMVFNLTTGCPNYFFNSQWFEWCGTGVTPVAAISSINCAGATTTGSLTQGMLSNNVSVSIGYLGGNGGSYSSQSISSTGVTGLTATLSQGNMAIGAGTLSFTITGTPASAGTATFAIAIGGQSCNLAISVASLATQYPANSTFCANGPTAIVDVTNPTTGKTWMNRNLGASQVATSITDQAAYGDLYQWGRRTDGHQCRTSSSTATLSSVDQPVHGSFITGNNAPFDWRSPQNTNLWQGVNGVNNPCPNGYRIPTETELNNDRLSWPSSNAAGGFASIMKFTMGGIRYYDGTLLNVGATGRYWSSNINGTNTRTIEYDNGYAAIQDNPRSYGMSVRCIKEIVGTLGALNCGGSTTTGNPIIGMLLSNVTASVPYTGGNGGYYAAQTTASTGVTGLTATLSQGVLINGAGSLNFTISGTPASAGNATFAIAVGGQSCSFTVSVAAAQPQYPANSVFCAAGATAIVDVTNPTTGITWMDRNLGASQVATSTTDQAAYGDLYQWGRRADGHQCRTSPTTATLSSIDQPAHGNFILEPNNLNDWRSPQNANLWQGVNGVNNPCPSGYRLPTETEINAERLSWSQNNSVGAFASPLKWTLTGLRDGSNGTLAVVGAYGGYWSSTVSGTGSRHLYFNSSSAYASDGTRNYGFTVRCLKN